MLTQYKMACYLPQKQYETQVKDEHVFSHFKKKSYFSSHIMK